MSTLGGQRRDTGSQLEPLALGKSLDWEPGAAYLDPALAINPQLPFVLKGKGS